MCTLTCFKFPRNGLAQNKANGFGPETISREEKSLLLDIRPWGWHFDASNSIHLFCFDGMFSMVWQQQFGIAQTRGSVAHPQREAMSDRPPAQLIAATD
jgi:hypothetical protein